MDSQKINNPVYMVCMNKSEFLKDETQMAEKLLNK